MLSHPDDLKRRLHALSCAAATAGHHRVVLGRGPHDGREIGNSAALLRFVKWEVMPGAGRNQLERFIRNSASSYWHDTCFGQMGRDSMSVVDGQLRVQRHRHAAYCRWRRHAARDDREHARHLAASSRERAAEILPAAHELRRHEP